MAESTKRLLVAEIPYASGAIHFRFTYYLSPDRKRWIRHGQFCELYENGTVASEGLYEDGLQQGPWRDYHENGQVAGEGHFVDGVEDGVWQFWTARGKEDETIVYRDGVEVDA